MVDGDYDVDAIDYAWSEGNFSCDCNRELFFLRGQGIEPSNSPDCGEGKYVAEVSNAETNEIYYTEES